MGDENASDSSPTQAPGVDVHDNGVNEPAARNGKRRKTRSRSRRSSASSKYNRLFEETWNWDWFISDIYDARVPDHGRLDHLTPYEKDLLYLISVSCVLDLVPVAGRVNTKSDVAQVAVVRIVHRVHEVVRPNVDAVDVPEVGARRDLALAVDHALAGTSVVIGAQVAPDHLVATRVPVTWVPEGVEEPKEKRTKEEEKKSKCQNLRKKEIQ
uniref:Uncharacterized protein n=1 Tax=Romanomermis culicivorax TaxID=13658 RepID=A0A915LDB1_ROMCU